MDETSAPTPATPAQAGDSNQAGTAIFPSEFDRWLTQNFGDHPYTVITTNLFAVVAGAFLIWFCFQFGQNADEHVLNVFIASLGALAGWVLGIFFAPYNKDETARFSAIGQSVSAFASGYLVSKLDRFLEASLFVTKDNPAILAWIRTSFFFSGLLIVMLTVFSNRMYFRTKA